MELSCLRELSSLEQFGIVFFSALSVLLILIGLVRAAGKQYSKESTYFQNGKRTLTVSGSSTFVSIGIILAVAVGVWLWNTFPSDSIKFSQKPWTLEEVKDRLQQNSQLRINLKGNAPKFALTKEFSGACATDVLVSICEFYGYRMECDHVDSNIFNIEVPP